MGFDKCILSCIHLCSSILQNSVTALGILCGPPIHPPPPQPLANTDALTVSILLPFPECHTLESHSVKPLQTGLFPLSFLHVFLWLGSSFLFITK